jgi:hypothetical protein
VTTLPPLNLESQLNEGQGLETQRTIQKEFMHLFLTPSTEIFINYHFLNKIRESFAGFRFKGIYFFLIRLIKL